MYRIIYKYTLLYSLFLNNLMLNTILSFIYFFYSNFFQYSCANAAQFHLLHVQNVQRLRKVLENLDEQVKSIGRLIQYTVRAYNMYGFYIAPGDPQLRSSRDICRPISVYNKSRDIYNPISACLIKCWNSLHLLAEYLSSLRRSGNNCNSCNFCIVLVQMIRFFIFNFFSFISFSYRFFFFFIFLGILLYRSAAIMSNCNQGQGRLQYHEQSSRPFIPNNQIVIRASSRQYELNALVVRILTKLTQKLNDDHSNGSETIKIGANKK